MELGWPLPKRKQHLRDLSTQNSDKTHPVNFQGRQQYLKIHAVPIGLPLYRLENGRTTSAQAEYVATNKGTSADFFRADNELEVAQRAQHRILIELAKASKNLFKEFEDNPQTEPIILSTTGYVINGNRRLSTWRALYETEPSKFKRFSSIDVVILPHADETELDRLEADLQLKEDLKAEYGWASKALMLKEKMQRYQYSEEQVSSIYGMTKNYVKELFDILAYGEQYLEARNKSKQYSDLEEKEFAFRAMSRSRTKLTPGSDIELFETAAFCLIDEATEGNRIYAEIPKIADHLDAVRVDLADAFDISDAGLSAEQVNLKLAEQISEPAALDKARLVIRNTIEAEAARQKSKKKLDYVAAQIERAKLSLIEAKNAIDLQSSKKGVIETLNLIGELVEELRLWATSDGH